MHKNRVISVTAIEAFNWGGDILQSGNGQNVEKENPAIDDKRKRVHMLQLGLQPTFWDLINFACNKSDSQDKT